jgi:hypothetical protein
LQTSSIFANESTERKIKKFSLSYKEFKFRLKGELEYEFLKSDKDDNAHFQLDKFMLKPIIEIKDNLRLDAQIYFEENQNYLNEFHIKFYIPVLNFWIDTGLYERWIKKHHARETEAYPLIGTAFYRDDALTISWGGEINYFYWIFSLGNGYRLNQKQVSEDTASKSKIIHDDRSSSLSEPLEYGINLGLKKEFTKEYKLDILSFFYIDKLNPSEISLLQSQLNDYISADDDKKRYGIGIKYEFKNSRFYTAYIASEDGALKRRGFFIEALYRFRLKYRKFFTELTPLISYGQLNVDNPSSFEKPWTWDRKKWIFALISNLYKNIKLKMEYYLNEESNDGIDFDNDEVLLQLEIRF